MRGIFPDVSALCYGFEDMCAYVVHSELYENDEIFVYDIIVPCCPAANAGTTTTLVGIFTACVANVEILSAPSSNMKA